ncbi:hypothetical protein PENSPDRAFT_672542 [Peniophora sp. CONT]|nr:hypothetical protein PENSPDRAFT_672542 [Peniophora sp. CONT]
MYRLTTEAMGRMHGARAVNTLWPLNSMANCVVNKPFGTRARGRAGTMNTSRRRDSGRREEYSNGGRKRQGLSPVFGRSRFADLFRAVLLRHNGREPYIAPRHALRIVGGGVGHWVPAIKDDGALSGDKADLCSLFTPAAPIHARVDVALLYAGYVGREHATASEVWVSGSRILKCMPPVGSPSLLSVRLFCMLADVRCAVVPHDRALALRAAALLSTNFAEVMYDLPVVLL